MIKLKTAAGLASTVSLVALAVGPAAAQTVNYGDLEQIFGHAITTSATGSPQEATNVPVNMEIISAEDIRRSGATDIPGVLAHVAGVDVLRFGANDADVGINGYDQPLNPRLLVLIDGRQVYADFFGLTPWSSLPVELSAIRQIEVVKGPNSALFGFNAADGVINIVTYSPLYDNINTVSVTGGTQSDTEGSAVVTTKLGETTGVRLQYGERSNDDFNSPLTPAEVGVRRGDNRESLNLNILSQIASNVQLDFEATHTNSQGVTQEQGEALVFARYDTNSVKAALSAETGFGLLQATGYTNWIEQGLFAGTSTVTNTTNANRVTVLQLQDLYKVDSDNTVRASLEYRYNTVSVGGIVTSLPGGMAGVPGASVFYSAYSGGLMWDWKVTPTVTLTNAVRLDQVDLGRSGPVPFGSPFANSAYSQSITEGTFNSGLVWRADPADTVRLTAARGVELPDLDNSGAILVQAPGIGVAFSGVPTLQPVTVTKFEAGLDRNLAEINGLFRFSVFHEETDNIISTSGGVIASTSPILPTIVTPFDAGSSTANGVELSLNGKFLEDWRWGLSYTPEFIDDHLSPAAKASVDFEHTTPQHIVKANIGWASGPWEVDGFVRYESNFFGVNFSGVGPTGIIPISNYVAFDGRVAYRFNEWLTGAVSGQNLSQAAQQQTASPNVDRTVFGSLTAKF
jgi:outer membrane receptor for ferrienterochelin and colicins